ncbi:E3 ubiquitin-protein ligase RMA1H1 isoform X2 [Arachis ipaensis]|uniref:E3 ubiquitin-protein ligase RMA1H1 isoform X2 n=1 Tax=Arachis ipaensis TaxID=130454 RepID=UPI000A2B2E51|nr:E3 ubiquitin-protein ligase RMA1H1 isoform X2 [Arachis ipaensis]
MDLHQYFEGGMPQMDYFEDNSSLEMWKCASDSDAIADSDGNASGGGFECNICLECVQDPVVTLCGHLYCWPCIYKWLNFRNISSETGEKRKPQCPVCKSEISQSSLVPLYGRGQASSASEDKAHQAGVVIPRRPLGPGSSSSYSSPLTNSFNTTYGIIGETIYARVFGNQVTNIYTYPNSYHLAGNNNPRIRRYLMEADRSLSRICFFLFCCTVLCLLLF